MIRPGGRLTDATLGLRVPWQAQPLFNARAETLSEPPTFRQLLARRCSVPATAYFDWNDDGRAKRKMRVRPRDMDLFSFAALYAEDHVTIVTCTPAPGLAHIYDRMPVILTQENESVWRDSFLHFESVEIVHTHLPNLSVPKT